MIRCLRIGIVLPSLCLLLACTTTPPATTLPPAQTRCLQAFVDDDARLAEAGIHDAQAVRVPDHPYLRVDRLLASFTGSLATVQQRAAWLEHAAALDAQGRALEHARLPQSLSPHGEDELQACRTSLSRALLDDDTAWPALLAVAEVPDDYSDTRRALGLYGLTSRLVMHGVKRMQRQAMPHVLDMTAADTVAAERYGLADNVAPTEMKSPMPPWPLDALGIPRIDAEQLAHLLPRYAPALSVVTASADDLPGQVIRPSPPYLDTTQPTLYTQLAYTRFGDHVLPQLVYTWWFAARTARGVIDPLAGKLDGLSWRVTLDSDGEPLAYDLVHNCGCYHMFFPGERLRARELTDDSAEPPWIPFAVPTQWQGRLRLILASGSHYLTALAPAGSAVPDHRYQLASYDALRNLPTGERHSSLFDTNGLVPGSARSERWWLWPMGVVAPGSMRQWGHQATAFVGRRHFDEARLLERYFERASSLSAPASSTD